MSAPPPSGAAAGGGYELSTDPARVRIDVVHGFLSGCYWSEGIRREVVEAAVRHSLVAGAYERSTGAQVGFARAVTDYATFAWLCDVFVLEPHRGRGLATGMVRLLMGDPRVRTLRRWCLATRDAHGVYAPLGFTPVEPGRWMERKADPAAWRDPAAPRAPRAPRG